MSTEQLTDPAGIGWRHARKRARRAASMLSAPQLVTGLSPLRFRCGALIALTCATCDFFSTNFGKRATVFSKDAGSNAVLRQSDHFTADARDATCWASAENGDFYC